MNVLIVEDADVVRETLRTFLSELRDVDRVGAVAFLAEAERLCRTFVPDLAVLDVLLPDGNGMELIGTLRTANPTARIVMLSNYADVHREAALKSGAHLFIDKSMGLVGVGEALLSLIGEMAKGCITPST